MDHLEERRRLARLMLWESVRDREAWINSDAPIPPHVKAKIKAPDLRTKAEALDAISEAHERKVQAEKDLERAICAARDFGASNVGIASRIGVTEAAIRMKFKRAREAGKP